MKQQNRRKKPADRAGAKVHPFAKFEKKKPEARTVQKKRSSRFSADRNTRGAGPDKTRGFREPAAEPKEFPLNKYMAHAGVCARRKAVDYIKEGAVKVNGKVQVEPGYKVQPGDRVTFNGKPLRLKQQLEYVLLNKPKDYLTTTKDPKGRKTVMDLIRRATTERVYPVGRLDRNTCGLLLFTNDGELAQQLAHPSGQIKKVYHVTLNKALQQKDFEQILTGVPLEDGLMVADALAYTDEDDHRQVGLEIHSGRNRVVRRIFEQLGYEVKLLDRVLYAGLTKKNLPRGKWRHLTGKEVRILKHFTPGKRSENTQ